MENPFLTFGYVSPDLFCDRIEETQRIISLLTNGNNIALISPRRMGKTGLLHHCFAQPEIKNKYHTFLIDIYSARSLKEMVYAMGREILNVLKPKGKKAFERFVTIVTSLRSGISYDATGTPSWNLEIGDIKTPDFTLDEIFTYLENADKPCIVAIDEFQSVRRFPEDNTEAILRTYIQRCKNAWFIFSGSQRSMMSEIFNSPSRAFYQSVSLMSLKAITLTSYSKFIHDHFTRQKKEIEQIVIDSVYQQFDGITWYVQKLMNELFASTKENETCCIDKLQPTIQHIINEQEEGYKELLFRIPIKQKELLFAISKEGKASQITSGTFVKKHKLTSASSVQKAAKSLVEQQVLTQELGIYEIYDKFFALWLVQSQQ
jgi:AAA+ ATPase superfamily predicted ATPase